MSPTILLAIVNPISMLRAKLVTSFAKYTDSALVSKAESILLACTDNEFFPKPTPTLPVLQDAITALNDAIAAAVDGSRIKIAERKKARTELENLLRPLNSYVSMVAMGDETVLVSSGFDLFKAPVPQPELSVPGPPVPSSGLNTGEVLVKVSRVDGVKSYIYECTPDPLTDGNVWQQGFESRSRFLFTGLPAGKKYWFRITAIGLRGAKAESKSVVYVVQ